MREGERGKMREKGGDNERNRENLRG